MTFASKEGCSCTNTTSILASLSDRRCQLSNGDDGIQLTLGGTCVPFSYGSSKCLQHDLLYTPDCEVDRAGDHVIPSYCFRPFCYVDAARCKRESNERVYRSSYFSFESDIDLFYSYSTCNSTADDWLQAVDDIVDSKALGGVSISGNIPTYMLPMMYKRDINGEALTTPGSEYYDDSIPYEGAYLQYVKKIMEISNGDIRNITVTHRSKASSLVHPTSSYTAAVQDLNDGLVDMAIGPFWITGQRLKLSAFTLPIVSDKTYLVIPAPGKKDTLNDQVLKVLAPFSTGLWGLVLGIILFASLLSVWFSDRSVSDTAGNPQNDRRTFLQRGGTPKKRRRKRVYARLALDSFLEKGLFFCSAGVEQDKSSSLPNKVLLFGFGWFILIAVSAYVANLAAFLTLSGTSDGVKTMGEAVAKGVTICAHPALKAELQVTWPDAKFYFHESGREFPGLLDDYDAGKCRFMAVGYEDTSMDTTFLNKLCERGLVYTDSLIVEVPVAFPIRSSLASGFSYWIYQGERYHDVSLQSAKDQFSQDIGCNVHYSGEDTEGSDHDQISVKNMFFPIMFFVAAAAIGIVLQLIHLRKVKTGSESLVGRCSSLNLVADMDSKQVASRELGRKRSWTKRRLSCERDLNSKSDDEEEYGNHNVNHSNNNNNDDKFPISNVRSIMKGDLPQNDEIYVDNFEDNSSPLGTRVTFGE